MKKTYPSSQTFEKKSIKGINFYLRSFLVASAFLCIVLYFINSSINFNNVRHQFELSKKRINSLEKKLRKLEIEQGEIFNTIILFHPEHSKSFDNFGGCTSYRPEPPINGKVMAFSAEVNLAMLSAGVDDGVKKGYHFTVYRGPLYIGQVVVEHVFKDMCSGRMKLETMAKGQQILEGDNVSTRFR